MNILKYLIQLITCIFLFTLNFSTNAQSFLIQNGSELYDVEIEVKCSKEECAGEGNIKLYQKNAKQIFEQFISADLSFYLDENFKPSVNIVELYGEQSPLIFDDFNFDGHEDLAIRNGNGGSYGGPTYDIYVFHKTKRQFVYSEDLTSLTHENLGMFEVDHMKKRITTLNKSGCCWHITSE